MMTSEPHDTERIIRDQAILGGRPVVRGTRIPVEVVLDYLAHNSSFDELFADYLRLSTEDVKACIRTSLPTSKASFRPTSI